MIARVSALTVAMLLAGAAFAGEPIEGKWRTASGSTAEIADCGGGYCITLRSGKYNGKQIGKLSGKGNNYDGSITDPETDKTYTGSAEVKGGSMNLKGCVLGIFCKSQTWTRM